MQRYAVIGLGRFGYRMAELLASSGQEVIAVDSDKDLIDDIAPIVSRAVCMDATDEDALRAQGIDDVDVAVVGIGSAFEAAVLTTVLLKQQLKVPRVISRSTSVTRGEILSRVGADELVNPERESADRWRNRLLAPHLIEQIDLADNSRLVQIPAPTRYVDKTLGELDVRRNDHVQVVAVRRVATDTDADGAKRTRQIVVSVPEADTVIQKDDTLLIIGPDDAVRRLSEG